MKVYAEDCKSCTTCLETSYVFGYVYLHGKLEEKTGFDIVDTKTKKETENISEGIHDVEVVFPDGTSESAKLFYWHGKYIPRGLIVSPTDEEAMKYAQECFDNRVNNL